MKRRMKVLKFLKEKVMATERLGKTTERISVYRSLPTPNEFGNFHFSEPAFLCASRPGPVIYAHKELKRHKDDSVKSIVKTGRWYVLISPEEGFIWHGSKLAMFSTPAIALEALNEKLSQL